MGVNGSQNLEPSTVMCSFHGVCIDRFPPTASHHSPKTGLFGQTQDSPKKDAAESKRGDVRLVWELLAGVRGLLALPRWGWVAMEGIGSGEDGDCVSDST